MHNIIISSQSHVFKFAVILDKYHTVWRKGFVIPEGGGIMLQNFGTCPPTRRHFPKTFSSQHKCELLLVTLIQSLSMSGSITKHVSHDSVKKK